MTAVVTSFLATDMFVRWRSTAVVWYKVLMYDDDYDDEDDYGTVPCPNCGDDVYDDSPQCPKCGEYITGSSNMSNKPTWFRNAFIVIVILTILSFVLPSVLGLF